MAGKKSSRRPRRAAARSGARNGGSRDVLSLLKEDHAKVKGLLEQFEKARGAERKSKLAETICTELKLHARLEEELLYPAARGALDEADLVDEAKVEHDSAKELISQIEASGPQEPLFDAKVKVLGEYVLHHVKEEENEMFPELRRSDLDLVGLGEQLRERKRQLQSQRAGNGTRRSAGDRPGATA